MEKITEESESHAGNWNILVWGLPRTAQALSLAPGITLRPIESKLTIFDLAAAGAAGFQSWAVLEPASFVAFNEIESAKDADLTPGYDTLNRAWLASSLLVLRGYTQHMCVACSAYSWNMVAGHQKRSKEKLPPFKGQLLDFHIKMLVNKSHSPGPVSPQDASWVNGHFRAFNSLAAESEPFRFALEAAIDWRFAKDSRAAIARLWGGVESLFGIKTELVHRISLYCACLQEKRGKARIERFHEIKDLYDLRSKAVHGAKLSPENMADALDRSFRLLSGLLLGAIARGRVPTSEDLDQAVFVD